jgi:predicted RNase H-like HicB family nuclease
VLDLTTHGEGVEGAFSAVQELVEGWVAERVARGESVPTEAKFLIGQTEIAEAVQPSG